MSAVIYKTGPGGAPLFWTGHGPMQWTASWFRPGGETDVAVFSGLQVFRARKIAKREGAELLPLREGFLRWAGMPADAAGQRGWKADMLGKYGAGKYMPRERGEDWEKVEMIAKAIMAAEGIPDE